MKTIEMKNFNKLPIVKFTNIFYVICLIIWFSLFIGCTTYGVGGTYTSTDKSELGLYIFGDSNYVETTVGYNTNLSGKDVQSVDIGLSLKFPLSFKEISLFPLANIEYQRILGGTERIMNLGWLRFGGGLDFFITDTLYLRGEGIYAPNIFSSLPKTDMISFNRKAGYSIRLGLGLQPGALLSLLSPKQKTTASNTQRTGGNTAPSTNDRNGWDIASLDTARNVNYLSNLEKDVILELNIVRSNPGRYAELYIKPRLQYFNGNTYFPPGSAGGLSTSEGAKAVQECYGELKNAGGRSVLLPKRGLSLAAKDHVSDTGSKGLTGHTGTDGSSMSDRINRYGSWGSTASENISYGYNAARDIIIQLLIDDATPGRGHRVNIMNPNSKYVGVAIGTHTRYGFMCVQDFAGTYTDK
jgi:uncharacterized protein YkwD